MSALFKTSVCLLLIVFLAASSGQNFSRAEDSPPAFIHMLSMVPASAAITDPIEFLQIQYADFRAVEQARPGVPTPADWAAFLADKDLWLANVQRLIAGPPDLSPIAAYDAEFVNYYGFDIFEIDRTLYFGPPPLEGAIYGGHFDVDHIAQTLISRTYTTTDLNGFPVVCGPVGCENGADPNNWLPDVGERDPETFRRKGIYPIFGGRLGMQQPLALPPGYILASRDWNLLDQMTAAAAGTADSLYSVPEIRTVADFAVTRDPLIQVLFFPPISSGAALPGDLPPYTLGALVDHQDGPDQLHSIVLVYSSEADAQQAAAEVLKRIPLQNGSLETGDPTPFVDLLETGYTLEPPQVVPNAETNLWLAVATVRVPLPGNDPDPETGKFLSSGRLLSLWYYSWMMRDFTPVLLSP